MTPLKDLLAGEIVFQLFPGLFTSLSLMKECHRESC